MLCIEIWNLYLLQSKLRTDQTVQAFKKRITNFWSTTIERHIKQGKNVLIVAPGIVLKKLVLFIESK